MPKLNAIEREIIRSVAAGNGALTGYDHAAVKSVLKKGHIWYDVIHHEYHLTTKGVSEHRRIMSSGDGPEALKDLFNP